jgi:transposase InsO family protein
MFFISPLTVSPRIFLHLGIPVHGATPVKPEQRSRSQLELAVVEYIGWYNGARLHESLGDIPPVEYEQRHADAEATTLVGATA